MRHEIGMGCIDEHWKCICGDRLGRMERHSAVVVLMMGGILVLVVLHAVEVNSRWLERREQRRRRRQLQPRHCLCKLVEDEIEMTECYSFTNRTQGLCSRRACEPIHECVRWRREANAKCVRRLQAQRVVPIARGICALLWTRSYVYVPM